MKIKQTAQLEFDINFNRFYPVNLPINMPISFVYLFILDASGYALKKGISAYIKILESIGNDACQYEEINICLDRQTNLIYIFEGWHDYKGKSTTHKIEQLLEEENFVQLCRMNFLKYAAMTKENFIHFLLALEKIILQGSPFILLYLDDKGWYNVLPFETQKAIKQFIADNTQHEII